ncbi:hypothetical protein SAMN05660657_04373 [Geodermatophilus amargosae]|uniref:Camelysin metallo-endopeptidase n=1 Tax=Geodermatophilus amargosae TaxID=1296565 RepID=A0A1I7CDX4_9ACTN|nr:hypothetical protein [Geodermatophilus amargosae]SFT97620.1 hypothetical protein SAMN05660657_04373 [Geodermatophilus amargosae]
MTTYRTVRRPSHRTGRLGLAASVLLGLIASACLIWQTSAAAYTHSTGNAVDSWETGSVHLTDDGGAAMFTVRGLRPGMTGTHCITVSSTGTVPSTAHLYGVAPAATNGLDGHLRLTVAEGSGGSFGSCTGFTRIGADLYDGSLADFPESFADGVGTWQPAGTSDPSAAETRSYRFTYLFAADAPDSTQNSSASVTFTWEAQSR